MRRACVVSCVVVLALQGWVLSGCDRPAPVPNATPTEMPQLTRPLPTWTPKPTLTPQSTVLPPTRTPTALPTPSAAPSAAVPSSTAPVLTPTTVATALMPTVFASPRATLASPTQTPAEHGALQDCVVAQARYYAQRATAYRSGGVGPIYFDCTGFVYRVFADCQATELIGARGEQPVRSYYDWFAARGQADALPPQPGDLIVHGQDFAHLSIYVGNGRAISALLDGIREHDAVNLRSGVAGEVMPVKAYLHIQP